jgi:hypothetical protein
MGSGASISPGGAQGKWGINCVTNQDLDGDCKLKKCAPSDVPKVQVEARPMVGISTACWGAPDLLKDKARFYTGKGGGIYELTISMLTMVHFMY